MAAGMLLPATSATAREYVIVIAGDGVGGASRIGDGEAGNLRRGAGQQPGLNLAGDLQVALHDHAVGDLEHQQQEQQQRRPEVKIEFDALYVASFAIELECRMRQQDRKS